MARSLRVVVPGFPHHITQRGNRRQQTFFSRQEYETFIKLLGECSERCGFNVWDCCILSNHTHVLGVPQQPDSLARTFSMIHAAYARKVNRRHQWQGHLWQERFHSFVLDERHLLCAARYILQNPVKAGLVKRPEAWAYSSARAHVGLAPKGFLKTEMLDELVGDWKGFLRTPPDAGEVRQILKHTRSGLPLGSEEFIEALEGLLERSLRPPRRGRPPAQG